MIAVATRRKRFDWLAAYLVGEARGVEPERVGWAAARNLPTEDPRLAAIFMRATAAKSQRVEYPVFHVVLSFSPDDSVDRATMERVADQVLRGVGLAAHQAILVSHRDRPYPHVHLLINRVHPTTGRCWSTWHAWRRVREVLNEEERALGLHQAPSHWAPVNAVSHDLRTYERIMNLAREQYRAELETSAARDRTVRLERTAERARTALATSDQSLARVYREPGAAYRAYVAAVDEKGPTEATELMRAHPERLGELITVERGRAFGLGPKAAVAGARGAAPAAASAAREAFEATRAWQQGAEAEALRVEQDFERALAAIYQDPAAARRAFERLATERSRAAAAVALRDRPHELGPLRAAVGAEPVSLAERSRAATRGVEALQARATAAAILSNAHETRADVVKGLCGAELDRALTRERAIRADLEALPGRADIERRVRSGLALLGPSHLRRLETAITAPQWTLAMQLRRVARDIALGREEEREPAR